MYLHSFILFFKFIVHFASGVYGVIYEGDCIFAWMRFSRLWITKGAHLTEAARDPGLENGGIPKSSSH